MAKLVKYFKYRATNLMAKHLKIDPGDARRLPFALVAPELKRVESCLRDQVQDFDPGIEPYISYICDTAGKRIRPALSILVGGATGGSTPAI